MATIVAILAGAFSIGEKRLQQLRSPVTAPPPAVIAPTSMAHAATGLQAPAPLPLAGPQPGDRFPAPNPAAEPDDSTGAPPAPAGPPSVAAIAPAVPDENPGAAPRHMTLSEYLGFTQFTKLRDAYLDRPDPRVNPGQFQRPQALSDLSVAHAESRISPPTMGQVIAGGQSYSQLSQQRAQARLNRAGLATTQPVTQ